MSDSRIKNQQPSNTAILLESPATLMQASVVLPTLFILISCTKQLTLLTYLLACLALPLLRVECGSLRRGPYFQHLECWNAELVWHSQAEPFPGSVTSPAAGERPHLWQFPHVYPGQIRDSRLIAMELDGVEPQSSSLALAVKNPPALGAKEEGKESQVGTHRQLLLAACWEYQK